MIRVLKDNIAFLGVLVLMLFVVNACAADTEVVEVVKEVPVEVVVEKEVVKEVPVEVVVEKEVIKEVPGDVVTVTKEIEVIKEIPKTVTVEKVVEVEKEVVKDPGELVIYSGRSEILIGSLVKMFEEATGIDVRAKYGKTFPIAATPHRYRGSAFLPPQRPPVPSIRPG